MKSRLLIHDLHEQEAGFLRDLPDISLFPAKPQVAHCVGCFGCWIKTPGECLIRDRCAPMPGMLSKCGEVVILSRIVYGGYSPQVKAVLDRSIGYILPYFRIVSGEMHHSMRYDNPFRLTVLFYGEAISRAEKDIARRLVSANAVNLGAGSQRIFFHSSAEELVEVIR